MADSTGKVDCPSCGLPQLVINFDEKTCFCSNCKLSISLTTYLKHRFGFDFKYRGVSYSYTLARQYEGTSKSSLEFLSDRGFVSLLTVDVDHDLTIFEDDLPLAIRTAQDEFPRLSAETDNLQTIFNADS